jgi:16S rRNA (guanine966-N2)-methyltransferase
VSAETAERFVQRGVVAPWGLVLVDPPYDLADDDLAAVLAGLALPGALDDRAVLAVERSTRAAEPPWPDGIVRFDRRAYGETVVWFAEPEPEPGPAAD